MSDKPIWKDHKGREIEIHTMSNRWLNKIRKKFKGDQIIDPIIAEIKKKRSKQ